MLEKPTNKSHTKESQQQGADEQALQNERGPSHLRYGVNIEEYLQAAKYRRVATEAWSSLGVLPNIIIHNDLPPEVWKNLCAPYGKQFTALGELGEILAQGALSVRQSEETVAAMSIREQAQRYVSEIAPLLEVANQFVRKAGAIVPKIRSDVLKFTAKKYAGMLALNNAQEEDKVFDSALTTLKSLSAGLLTFAIPATESESTFNLGGFLDTYKLVKGNSPEQIQDENQDETSSHDVWIAAPPQRTGGIMLELLNEIELVGEQIKKLVAQELSEGMREVFDTNYLSQSQQELFPLLTIDSLVKIEIVAPATLHASITLPLSSHQLALMVANQFDSICATYEQIAESINAKLSTSSETTTDETEQLVFNFKVVFQEASEEDVTDTAFFTLPPQSGAIHSFSQLNEALLRVPHNGTPYRLLMVQNESSQVKGVTNTLLSRLDDLTSLSNKLSLAIISSQSSAEEGEEQRDRPDSLRIHLVEAKSFQQLGWKHLHSQVQATKVTQRVLHKYGLDAAYQKIQVGELTRTPSFLSIKDSMLCDTEVYHEVQALLGKIGIGTVDLTQDDKQILLAGLKELSTVADELVASLPEGENVLEYRLSYVPPHLALVGNRALAPLPARILIEDPQGRVLYQGELNSLKETGNLRKTAQYLPILQKISDGFYTACKESFTTLGKIDAPCLYRNLSTQRISVTKSLFDSMYDVVKAFEVIDLDGLDSDRIMSELIRNVEWNNISEIEWNDLGVNLLYLCDRPVGERVI